MTLHRKFKHEPLYTFHNGFTKTYCRCGWQTRKTDSFALASGAYEEHVALKKRVLHEVVVV